MFRSSSRIWAELGGKAFRRLAGATRVVVLDNLREGVLTPDVYDPASCSCITCEGWNAGWNLLTSFVPGVLSLPDT